MSIYNDKAYSQVINEFVNDTYYVEGQSYGTKIEKIRQYTEIILRRLLKYDPKKMLELGDKRVIRQLDEKGYVEEWFRSSLDTIRKKGNNRTHTQVRKVATEEEFNNVVNSLFDLYAYLFYDFFKRHRFGTNSKILTAFSLLPPVIRYITLTKLFEIDNSNIYVIDKLAIATLKAKSKDEAIKWIESHEKDFSKLSSWDENAKQDFLNQLGPELGINVINSVPNMYDLCYQRVEKIDLYRNDKISYDSFESALRGYKKYGHIDGTTEDVQEFNQLMSFVFMGRKEQEKEGARVF